MISSVVKPRSFKTLPKGSSVCMCGSLSPLSPSLPPSFSPSLPLKKSWLLPGTLMLVCLINLSNHPTWKACLANPRDASKAATPTAGPGYHKGPDLTSNNQCFKNTANGATKFCPLHPLNNSRLLIQEPRKLFNKNNSKISRMQKLVKSLKHRFLCYLNKETFLIGKSCWSQWFLIWIVKMYSSLAVMI